MTIAKANNIKKGEQIIDDINELVKNWSDFASKVKVDDKRYKDIKSNLHLLKD